jgi:hypothetical protein
MKETGVTAQLWFKRDISTTHLRLVYDTLCDCYRWVQPDAPGALWPSSNGISEAIQFLKDTWTFGLRITDTRL